MSYLNVPRLVFSGKFMTDPSTVNNVPDHYDTDAFTPNYWHTGQQQRLVEPRRYRLIPISSCLHYGRRLRRPKPVPRRAA